MRHRIIIRRRLQFIASVVLLIAHACLADESLDYQTQVEPILRAHCYECHSGDSDQSVEGGLNLTSRRTALLRADSGEFAIVPGNAKDSLLLHRVTSKDEDERMPPEGERLSSADVQLLSRWIKEGAVWPEATSKEKHWAYVAPKKTAPPQVDSEHQNWPQNSIDHFTLYRMREAGLAPSNEADPARLIRRVHLDLIGLPPSIDTVNAFLAEPTDDHYAEIVKRLLASPRYGEKWARHWLDLARYSDSNGYQADQIREMWAFRDWVIAAMNDDMPYDQFTIEQLAGDLLPNATLEQKIATGFHRGTTCNVEAGVDPEENRTNQVIDRVNTTGTTWLGTTLECAQCHNHKYDPISQEEYYQIFAFFNNTPLEVKQEKKDSVQFNMAGPKLDLPVEPDVSSRLQTLRTRKKTLEGQLAKTNAKKAKTKLREQLEKLTEAEAKIAPATTLVMLELSKQRETNMFVRGSFLNPGARVEANVPAVLNSFPNDAPKNRLGFAKWLVAKGNPLTSRVAVNRWWREFFGLGIVGTIDDFGIQGEPPTHPELLDWLAITLQENGWSMKHVHEQIVTSSTYRQSSKATPTQLEADADNVWLARGPRTRLTAELIRDNSLAISGLLDCTMKGPPIYPPQPDGLWRQTGRNEPKFEAAKNQNRFRRGIYVVWRRAAPYPSFVTFDAPDRMTCVANRANTNTPLQALTLLNDEAHVEFAKAMAARVMRETADRSLPSKMEYALRLALARAPKPTEIDLLSTLYCEEFAELKKQPERVGTLLRGVEVLGVAMPEEKTEWAAWLSVCNAILNLDETISK